MAGTEELLELIQTEEQLEDELSTPSEALVRFISQIESPLLVLGAGGKMGPSLAVMAKRAATQARYHLEVIAVSRFSDENARRHLESHGVRTISCDLLDRAAVRQLPDSSNIIYLVGLKFGTAKNPALTWAMNTLVPANVVERYPKSRMVALSTGNVYPMSLAERGGSLESDPLTPVGEYANAAVARERLFEFCGARQHTPIALIRLFYAVELRYGVLSDIARKVLDAEPIDLTSSFINCIWQRDANDMILRSLTLTSSPPSAWNLCHSSIFRVREVATQLGELMGVAPVFKNISTTSALLGNSQKLCGKIEGPATPMDWVLRWTAHWVKRGGRNLGRPTHFEIRDGVY